MRRNREELQRLNLLATLRSSEELSDEEQIKLQIDAGPSALSVDAGSFDPTLFPVYYKHPRKLWLRDLQFLIHSENDPVFMQLSKFWDESEEVCSYSLAASSLLIYFISPV